MRGAQDQPSQVVHGDFSTWNLLFERGTLTGLLDFDVAHRNHRVADFAISWRGEHDDVVLGYDEVSPLGAIEWELLVPVFRAWYLFQASEKFIGARSPTHSSDSSCTTSTSDRRSDHKVSPGRATRDTSESQGEQMSRLTGKVAVVTGAARGIGRGHAMLLAEQGASVVVNDLGGEWDGSGADERPAQQVVDEIVAAGGKAVANYDDVADWEGGQRLDQRRRSRRSAASTS